MNKPELTYITRVGSSRKLGAKDLEPGFDVEYLVEMADGNESESIALNRKIDTFVHHFETEDIERVFKSEVFQRALMSNDLAAVNALKVLLPQKMQTANLIRSIMKQRQSVHGDNEQNAFLNDMVGHKNAWSGYAAFDDLLSMQSLSEKYGTALKNDKGQIVPTGRLNWRRGGAGTRADFENAVKCMKSAISFLAEQEQAMNVKMLRSFSN